MGRGDAVYNRRVPAHRGTLCLALLVLLALVNDRLPRAAGGCSGGTHPWGDAILESMNFFTKPITLADINDLQEYASTRFPGGWRVLIKDNKLYAAPLGKYNSTEMNDALNKGTMKIDHVLLLLQKMLCLRKVPDVEFVWRNNNGNYGNPPRVLPVFYYSRKSLREPGFLLPYRYTFLDMRKHRDSFAKVPWKEKVSKGIFRGATSCGTYTPKTWRTMPRTQLVWACRNRTDVCDGGFSKWAQITEAAIKEMEQEFGGLLPRLPMRDYTKWKYIIIPDGNTAPTSRMSCYFSNSTVIKQVSPVKEFFYYNMQPFVHYLPLSYQMTDIAAVLDWARRNDGYAEAIADNARKWAEMYLNNECVANYMADVFANYAKLLDFVPGSSGFPYKQVKLNRPTATYVGRACAGLNTPCGGAFAGRPSARRRPASVEATGEGGGDGMHREPASAEANGEGAGGVGAAGSVSSDMPASISSSSLVPASFSSSSLALWVSVALLGWGVVAMVAARRWVSSLTAKLT